MERSPYMNRKLWEQAKATAVAQLGAHSARAMQLAGKLYRDAGGRYRGGMTATQAALSRWTAQDWTTKSGKPSKQTGERYLPRKVIEQLTPAEYAATTRAKRKGTAAGKQFVKQPERIAAKVSVLKGNPMKKPTAAQLAARERFAEMARSGAFKRKAKRNPAKKTVSQKISQLMHEGYPQKQAVAVALSEQRKGKVKRNPVLPSANFDYPLITKIKLFAEKDEVLYRQQGRPIVENLARKMVKGQFDPIEAVKRYGYLADSAVKKYSVDQMGRRAPTLTILSKPEREVLAQWLFESFADEIKYTAEQMVSIRKRNPATGRKGSSTKLNPMAPTARSSSYSNWKYSVEAKRSLGSAGSVFEPLAGFQIKQQAQDYAKAILASHPSVTLRIKTYK